MRKYIPLLSFLVLGLTQTHVTQPIASIGSIPYYVVKSIIGLFDKKNTSQSNNNDEKIEKLIKNYEIQEEEYLYQKSVEQEKLEQKQREAQKITPKERLTLTHCKKTWDNDRAKLQKELYSPTYSCPLRRQYLFFPHFYETFYIAYHAIEASKTPKDILKHILGECPTENKENSVYYHTIKEGIKLQKEAARSNAFIVATKHWSKALWCAFANKQYPN